MATATRDVVYSKPTYEITLRLSEEEAQFLMDVTGCIGGDRTRSRRRFADTIGTALYSTGTVSCLSAQDVENGRRSIYFT